MTLAALKAQQKKKRQSCLDAILNSSASRKLIVAGPGTGKTFTFKQLLKAKAKGTNLAMTFIRKLVTDLEVELGAYAEVKTFHAYCKKVLHEKMGHVELVPYLTKIVEQDSKMLGINLENFETKIRTLEDHSKEVEFYLRRGDYYKVIGFDDAVYRLLKLLRKTPEIIPEFDQIVIDEFQDFNPLEVAFIGELEKKGAILIVGDDDQAVYEGRSASASFLQSLYKSGRYKVFPLPYCSRCPKAIVDATNAILTRAESRGYLKGRISKPFECYLETKESDNERYPKIVVAECTTWRVVPKYILREISHINAREISQSHKERYPTVLIIGPRHYLRETEKQIRKIHLNVFYSQRLESEYGIVDAYELILRDNDSNLGWRILLELFYDPEEQMMILAQTIDGQRIVELLGRNFVKTHTKAVELVRSLKENGDVSAELKRKLRKAVGPALNEIIEHFSPTEKKEEPDTDESKPSILLTSYVGSKGLSAGHVFIIGAHNESMPKDPNKVRDAEISQFVVALTRTRSQCHVISNRWLISPKDKKGNWLAAYEKTAFISWIPPEIIEDRGVLKGADFQS